MSKESFFKCQCAQCRESIEFPVDGVGETVPCPHCGTQTVLTRPTRGMRVRIPWLSRQKANLGKCKVCDGQVSSTAKSCPHCGAVLRKGFSIFFYVFVGTCCLIVTLIIIAAGFAFFLGGGVQSFKEGLRLGRASKVAGAPTWLTNGHPWTKSLSAKESESILAVAKMTTLKTDEVEGIDWITPGSAWSEPNGFYLYIGRTDSKPPILRLSARYHGSDWVFFNRLVFSVDGKKSVIPVSDVSRDPSGKGVTESADITAAPHAQLLWDISRSQKTILRFSGNQDFSDWLIPAEDKKSIENIVLLYRNLGGTF